ncbi:HDOD domain-containing protein [Sulfurospirillum arcachonense]|uniref:HDOD domain-containing protein n=1 Tax=Sulfurospirillum arcachonense TaxID=57666 RepID=UPI00046ADD72|nr:HDOD domain-containing protein [Sulfurospirillum arcachonense]
MLSDTTISEYIESIPPIPKIVKHCVKALDDGDLVHAADIANEDRALIHYLQSIINKPIFGFRDEVKNARQIFGILGILRAKQLIYGYYLLLILPKKWEVFGFSSKEFQDFQARLIHHWGKIMKFLQKEDAEIIQAISIIPASLIVCEILFRDINSTVKLLREKKQMSYEKILIKMTNRTFFDIASLIAKKWSFSDKTIELIKKIGDTQEGDFGENALAITYLRLLISYEMSRPMMIKSGLSDLFDFEPIFDDEIANNFYAILEHED